MAWGAQTLTNQLQDMVKQAVRQLEGSRGQALWGQARRRMGDEVARLRRRHEPLRAQLSRRTAALAEHAELPGVLQGTLVRVQRLLEGWAPSTATQAQAKRASRRQAASAEAAAVADATLVTPMAPVDDAATVDNRLAAGTTPEGSDEASGEAGRRPRRGGRQRRGGLAQKSRRPPPTNPR